MRKPAPQRPRNRYVPAVIVVIGVLLAVLGLGFAAGNTLGPAILRDDAQTDYATGIGWAFVLGTPLLIWPRRLELRRAMQFGWCLKIIVVLGAMLLYESHYSILDAYHYFQIGRRGFMAFEDLEFGNGTDVMLWLSQVHSSFIDSYHAQKVTYAFIGFLSLHHFYQAYATFTGKDDIKPFYVLLCVPSVLFWSSILGKDPIVIFGIALYVRAVVTWVKTGSFRWIPAGVFGILIAMTIRSWVGPILLAPLAAFVVFRLRAAWSRIVFGGIAIIGFFIATSHFLGRMHIETTEDALSHANLVSHAWAGTGGSGQKAASDFHNPLNLLLFLPFGMFTALFRPLPGEVANVFGYLASAENVALLYLLYRAIRGLTAADLRDPIIRWALLLIVTWSAIYGIVSYQNLGTAVRFRLQILPVLVGVFTYLGRPRATAVSDSKAASATRARTRHLGPRLALGRRSSSGI